MSDEVTSSTLPAPSSVSQVKCVTCNASLSRDGRGIQVDLASHLLFLEPTGTYFLQALDTWFTSGLEVSPATPLADSSPLDLTLYDTSPMKLVISFLGWCLCSQHAL